MCLRGSLCDLDDRRSAPREHDLREVFNGLHWTVRTGASWRMMPHDLPPWAALYQQTQRWPKAGMFEAIVVDCGRSPDFFNHDDCADDTIVLLQSVALTFLSSTSKSQQW